jgi:hypothetical protein
MAQPKGYAAFILFPHLKMIPRPLDLSIIMFMTQQIDVHAFPYG